MNEVQTQISDTPKLYYNIPIVEVADNPAYLAVKRVFDISVSLLLLIVLGIPMLLVGLFIRLDSPGPAIFKQERLGKDGVPFVIYKFRTMYVDAEKNGPQWAQENDERCTKLGAVIRKSRIDELPQLINVLKGEMSFVGPRPEREYFYNEFATYIDGFDQRLKVTPGITGWAQVMGGYELNPEEKILFDVEYMVNRSIIFDLKCMFMTARVVFTHEGAR